MINHNMSNKYGILQGTHFYVRWFIWLREKPCVGRLGGICISQVRLQIYNSRSKLTCPLLRSWRCGFLPPSLHAFYAATVLEGVQLS